MLAESRSTESGDIRTRLRFVGLLACFFLSGAAGLIYQVAWTRQFTFVFGSSELAVATVLAAYMAGLGAGATLGGRWCRRVRRPIAVYGYLELAVAAAALAVPAGLALARLLYLAAFGGRAVPPEATGLPTALFYLAAAFAILILPTGLMGATLPLLVRHAVRREADVGPKTGVLYATNTAGAMVGTIAAGFLLLPVLGLARTIYVAAGLNALVFVVAMVLSRRRAPERHVAQTVGEETVENDSAQRGGRWARHGMLVLVAASGAVSLVLEVLWTRLLTHLLGASVYAFATLLATFLAGIALGGAIAARPARTVASSVRGFAIAEIGIAATSVLSFLLVDFLPRWGPMVEGPAGARLLKGTLAAAAVLLPVALAIGATFPFAVRVAARDDADAGPASARVFAASTFGGIVGAVAGGFFLLPAVGYAGTVRGAAAVNLVLAIAVLALFVRRGSADRSPASRIWRFAVPTVVLLALLAVRLPLPENVLRFDPLSGEVAEGESAFHRVGRSATVLVADLEGVWQLRTNGLPEGAIEPRGMPTGRALVTRWLGALAPLAHPEARSALVVGLGAGTAVAAIPETVTSIDVIELEPEVVAANRSLSQFRGRDPLVDPRVHIYHNDARNALLLTSRRYDAVISQPSHPWTSGSSHLFTYEFFNLVRGRLADGGVFVQWVGLQFVDASLLETLLATLLAVFDHVRVYRPPTGAALLFLASAEPLDLTTTVPRALAASPAAYLPLGIARHEDLATALVLDEAGSRRFAGEAPIGRDDHNLLATRSPRILGQALARDAGRNALAPYDPLIGASPAFDHVYLTRRLLAQGMIARARRLAEAISDPEAQRLALGLVARAAGNRTVMATLLAGAEPGETSVEARGAYLLLRRGALSRPGMQVPDTFNPLERAVVHGWQAAGQGDWQSLRTLDDALSKVDPGHPLGGDAARLRATWRLRVGGGDAGLARVAGELLDPLLARGAPMADGLLRAEAAGLAGDHRAALALLSDLSRSLAKTPRQHPMVRRAQRVLERLPVDESLAGWRTEIAGRLGSGD